MLLGKFGHLSSTVFTSMKSRIIPFCFCRTKNRRRQWHPTPVLLPGKSHGRRSLVGCSPRGRWGSDMTEPLHFHFSLSCIGGGNGNPLQWFAWRIPGTGEPGGLPSMGSHRIGHDWSDLAAAAAGSKMDFRKYLTLILKKNTKPYNKCWGINTEKDQATFH